MYVSSAAIKMWMNFPLKCSESASIVQVSLARCRGFMSIHEQKNQVKIYDPARMNAWLIKTARKCGSRNFLTQKRPPNDSYLFWNLKRICSGVCHLPKWFLYKLQLSLINCANETLCYVSNSNVMYTINYNLLCALILWNKNLTKINQADKSYLNR